MKRNRDLPYWLKGGSENCELCFAVHVLEMQVRCVACDRGLCPQCYVLVRETTEIWCTECHGLIAEAV